MSRIFTPSEMVEMQRREKGDYSDKNGTFSSRVRPKIQELLNEWFPQSEDLFSLLEKKEKKKKRKVIYYRIRTKNYNN